MRWRAPVRQIDVHRAPQSRPGASTARARSKGCDESSLAEQPRIENGSAPTTGLIGQHDARGAGAQRRLSDRGEIGPLGVFLRPEQGGIDLVVIPTMRREENGVRGPAPARFHSREGGRVSSEL
mgnify:CR=1 FL=1